MTILPRRSERSLRWVFFLAGGAGLWRLAGPGWDIALVLAWGLITLEAWTRRRVPVLNYHSVSDGPPWLPNPRLVITPACLERQLSWLSRLGYRSIFLDELYELRKTGRNPRRAVCLTFDDGYLDNWLGALPLLEKYRTKATVFVSSGWLSDRRELTPRPPEADPDRIDWRGYLGRPEMTALLRTGLVDIQSHGHSHDRIFASDRLVDFVRPGHEPVWLHLALKPEDKAVWFEKEAPRLWGYPLFQRTEALIGRAFIPDPGLVERLLAAGARPGFFDRADWRADLEGIVAAWRAEKGSLGRLETPEESEARRVDELTRSRLVLEEILGRPVRHLCWPRNAWSEEVERLALAAGFVSTTASDGGHNGPDKPHRVERFGLTTVDSPFLDGLRAVLSVWVFKGHYVWWPLLALVHLCVILHWAGRKGEF